MSAQNIEQDVVSVAVDQDMEAKLVWRKPSVEDLQVAVGTQSVGLGNNDGSASHT